MRIVLAGASGFLGTQLVRDLRGRGHEVIRLVRRPPRAEDERGWDPRAGALDPGVFDGVDAVVNLCGVSVARLWTGSAKRSIRSSRVDATTTLARAVAAAGHRPRTLVSASAVGFYGDTGEQIVDERSHAGEGFLAEVCRVWEAATRPAEDAGVRVAHLRTGIVLCHEGGMLGPILPLFRLGLGGRIGGGHQYIPWIAMADWLGAVRFILDQAELVGPVNVVGPRPVTNAEFTKALGRVVHRPSVLPVPAMPLRLGLGGFAGELLDSHRVLPRALTTAGFQFTYQEIEPALVAAVSQ
jgi:uncharacterized protein